MKAFLASFGFVGICLCLWTLILYQLGIRCPDETTADGYVWTWILGLPIVGVLSHVTYKLIKGDS